MAAKQAGKRPFWAHQLVEYILGVALVASGLQSPTPIVPAVLGGFILVYSASTRGALAAFRLIDRRLHRVADPVLIAVQIVAAVQPWISVDNATRMVMVAIAVVHLVVWLGSSFTEKERRVNHAGKSTTGKSTGKSTAGGTEPVGDRSTELGRSAGRLAAKGVRAIRAAKANREAK